MPTIRQKVLQSVIVRLLNEQHNIRSKLFTNKFAFRKLTDEQTILKRELAVLEKLIRSVRGEKE